MTAPESVFGKRYGEVLLIRVGDNGPEAEVYNTFPLNDCPADLWTHLDPTDLAHQNDAAGVLLNGPRYWLMSRIEKDGGTSAERRTFGGLEMLRQATVTLSSMNPAPYGVNQVDRKAAFVYDSGHRVYELVDARDRHWVMQTYSQTVDPALTLDDLPRLADRLTVPPGWSYRTRILDEELRVDTTTTVASVLQDDLANTYSLLA